MKKDEENEDEEDEHAFDINAVPEPIDDNICDAVPYGMFSSIVNISLRSSHW